MARIRTTIEVCIIYHFRWSERQLPEEKISNVQWKGAKGSNIARLWCGGEILSVNVPAKPIPMRQFADKRDTNSNPSCNEDLDDMNRSEAQILRSFLGLHVIQRTMTRQWSCI